MKNRVIFLAFVVLFVFLGVLGAERYPAGKGNFEYIAPSDEFSDTIKVFYYIPENGNRTQMPVVIGFHGNDRDCSYWIDTRKEYAERDSFMFFIPWFTHESFPTRRYQEVGVKDAEGYVLPKSSRTTALIDSLISHILTASGTDAKAATIYGHSAGGQFVHRFMLMNDSPFVEKAIIGNPGWFTFPTIEENYSYGIKDLPEIDAQRLRSMCGKNVVLQLAEGDTIRESFLRKTPEADRQGRNRLERGNNFFDTLQKMADENGWEFNWRRVYVPEIGHDAVGMSRHAAQHLLYP